MPSTTSCLNHMIQPNKPTLTEIHRYVVVPSMLRFSNLQCAARTVVFEGRDSAIRMGDQFWGYTDCREIVDSIPYVHRRNYF